MQQLRVHIQKKAAVKDLLFEDGKVKGVLLHTGEILETNQVIVAVGGKSVPQTGSTGDGYAWARKAGHTITDLYPTEVPIVTNDHFIQKKMLQGLSLRDVCLSVIDPKKKKKLISHEGDLVFTHFGISGPIALRCSQFVVKALKKHGLTSIQLEIDLFPEKKEEIIVNELERLLSEQPKKAIKNILSGWLPERLIPILLQMSSIDEMLTKSELSTDKKRTLTHLLKHFPLHATGTLPLEKAFVTGGGVSVKEIHPKTMESKHIDGLYFCGEVLDIHGYTGGYNITVAFSTGYTAGQAAALKMNEAGTELNC